MGLDQYAYIRDKEGNQVDLQYWRKHNALQGWMENLYRYKGKQDDFNCKSIQLTSSDLDRLEEDVCLRQLPVTTGFFYGADTSQDNYNFDKDLEFIAKAREKDKEGYRVYYTSSY
jgi:hypothetical protein